MSDAMSARAYQFDRVDTMETHAGKIVRFVTHRNSRGLVFAFHSPLGDGVLTCSICASGVRVWVPSGE